MLPICLYYLYYFLLLLFTHYYLYVTYIWPMSTNKMRPHSRSYSPLHCLHPPHTPPHVGACQSVPPHAQRCLWQWTSSCGSALSQFAPCPALCTRGKPHTAACWRCRGGQRFGLVGSIPGQMWDPDSSVRMHALLRYVGACSLQCCHCPCTQQVPLQWFGDDLWATTLRLPG